MMVIQPSIYETNLFLNKNKANLIEYAAFYGSIQIFQYLLLNGAELTSSLWLYSIHSNCADMIHLLEENKIQPDDHSYEMCLKEAIKCHHNEIAHYIQDVLYDTSKQCHFFDDPKTDYKNNIKLYGVHYYNYAFFPYNFSNRQIIVSILESNHWPLVKILLKERMLTYMTKIDDDHFNHSPLNYAFMKNKTELLDLFISESGLKFGPKIISKLEVLNTFAVPSLMTEIPNETFKDCHSLNNVKFHSKVTFIGLKAFSNCEFLNNVSIPPSITEIGKGSFENCKRLNKITFESQSKLNLIDDFAFKGCIALNKVEIPPSVKRIGNHAFSGCDKLQDISIPSSLNIDNIGISSNVIVILI